MKLSEDFVFQLIHATSAEELSELLPSFLIQFCDHPDLIPFGHICASPARLARAFRAGVSAHRVLQGLLDKQVRPPGFSSVRMRNQVYVVARCRQFPGGFLHQRVRDLLRPVGCRRIFRRGQRLSRFPFLGGS